jgi:Protein of unknown function (DUF2480)
MEEIVNKVQNSSLIAVDLADYLPHASEMGEFDFAPQLWNGLILKEKDFRDFLAAHDWSIYASKHVYLHCSVDAILPSWAFMIVSSKLIGIAKTITVGTLQDAKQLAMTHAIQELKITDFQDGTLIIKGCSEIPNPEAVMSLFLQRVQPVCSSIMYGEPCSTVPVFKRPKPKAI